MIAHLLQYLHAVTAILPANYLQWLGFFAVLTLQFMMSRTKTVKANNFYESVANSILAIPAVGNLIKATPILGLVMKYFATPEPAVIKNPEPVADPLPTPPAAS